MKLDDFLKCKKVRCVNVGGHVYITAGKEYDVINLDEDSVYIVNDNHEEYDYLYKYFEPVLGPEKNPPQGMELTPEFEASEPKFKFKVGDKVYIPNIKNICTIRDDGKVITSNGQYYCDLSDSYDLCFVLATPENHALLSKLYPHIEFEQPPKPDAVERPLTLVEKLRNRRKEWASNPHYWMDSNLISDVFNDVIDIVKQHEAESEVQDETA